MDVRGMCWMACLTWMWPTVYGKNHGASHFPATCACHYADSHGRDVARIRMSLLCVRCGQQEGMPRTELTPSTCRA